MIGIQSKTGYLAVNTYKIQNRNSVAFCGVSWDADRFEKRKEPKKEISLFNPYSMKMLSSSVNFDSATNQDIMLETKNKFGKKDGLVLRYNPEFRDVLTDRNTGKKIETVILTSENPNDETQFTYHFMSEDLTKEYGYACMSKKVESRTRDPIEKEMNLLSKSIKKLLSNTEPYGRQDLTTDYKDRVVGDRVEIEYCQNMCPETLTGMGKLADKLAVRYCMENQIKPNVVFYSMNNSHIQNYNRGNYFLPLEKNSQQSKDFIKKYGTDNVNVIMDKLADTDSLTHEETKDWGDLGMYIPKNKVEEYSKNYRYIDLKLENPFKDRVYYSAQVYIDLDKPRTLTLLDEDDNEMCVKYSPEMKGHLTDKKTGKPVETYILQLSDDDEPDEDAFVFMSKDFKTKYGYVELDRGYEGYDEDLYYDYKKQGLVGDRVVVAYLKNNMRARIGGVGKLADRVAVKYCMDNGIDPPVIISHAAEGSHVAHYLRGKRFVPPFKSQLEYSRLRDVYGDANPNRILKRLIKQSKKDEEPVNIRGWGDFNLIMYLPKNLIDKYAEEGIV